MLVAGMDGCRAGWVLALWEPEEDVLLVQVLPTFAEAYKASRQAVMVGVDMPIGLPSIPTPGGRVCDAEARRLLGPGRTSSVFSPPVRAALAGQSYPEALALQRALAPDAPGFSKQCYNIFPKLREVDAHLTPTRQRRLREVHPEVSFTLLAGGQAIPPKKTAEGRQLRAQWLDATGLTEPWTLLDAFPRSDVQPDDILDALGAAWSARRIAEGTALRLPEKPEKDARGLRMEIWG